jgi:outer membrane protein OmpA-like peptidoglycan-associated protein
MKLLAFAVGLGLAASTAAQEQPAQNGPFLLFFDWGKPDIRSDDVETLDKVAAAWRARPSIHLQIAGHTDRSGSLATNRRAGLKRAETVRAELEKRGVPRNAMVVASFGEEQPLVPTEDLVREVQNRRVVIELKE